MSSSEFAQTDARSDLGAAYAQLRRTVVAAGLLKRAYSYYSLRIFVSYMLLAIAIGMLFVFTTYSWSLVECVLLGFAIDQIVLLGHDAGHLAVFRGAQANWTLGQLCWSLCGGMGFWYWCDRHNQHHGRTNDIDDDPDLQSNFLLAKVLLIFDFTHKHFLALRKRQGPVDHVKLPSSLRLPLFLLLRLLVSSYGFRADGWLFTLRSLRGRRRLLELVFLSLNGLLWLIGILSLGWRGLGIFIGTYLVVGLYAGLVFAPNHKGMPVWTRGTRLSFLERQVLSSRNVTSHPIWDFLYGGLNYQIEHHLFPTMPRVHFRRARAIIQPFCLAHGLPYEELDPWSSYRVAYASLRPGSNAPS